jgi:hypothetical protein
VKLPLPRFEYWATIASLVETCKLNAVDPLALDDRYAHQARQPLACIPHRRTDAVGLRCHVRLTLCRGGMVRPLTEGPWRLHLNAPLVAGADSNRSLWVCSALNSITTSRTLNWYLFSAMSLKILTLRKSWTLNQRVQGSAPCAPTIEIKHLA